MNAFKTTHSLDELSKKKLKESYKINIKDREIYELEEKLSAIKDSKTSLKLSEKVTQLKKERMEFVLAKNAFKFMIQANLAYLELNKKNNVLIESKNSTTTLTGSAPAALQEVDQILTPVFLHTETTLHLQAEAVEKEKTTPINDSDLTQHPTSGGSRRRSSSF